MILARTVNESPMSKTVFINPECGHEIEYHYGCPNVCPSGNCMALVPRVSALKGTYNQDNRVKYFVGKPI